MEASSESIVDRVYDKLKVMAVGYDFKPGERLNEGNLAKKFGVSRTPLREALNRLNTEGFLRFVPGKGFFCRELNAQEVFNLYELRKAIEVASIHLAIVRAKDEDIDALMAFLDEKGPGTGERETIELVVLDEEFHERLMRLSNNNEMLRVLNNINERIRFVRWIDMDMQMRSIEHRLILAALKKRDLKKCVALLENHIDRRMEQITSAIREGYAHIYTRNAEGSRNMVER